MAVAKLENGTIGGEVYERLRADIISCVAKPGSKINIQSLCQSFGVSLGAVREALSKLSAEGLVDAIAQRGYNVAQVSIDDVRELTQARIKTEQECVLLAIQNRSIDWETGIVGALHKLNRTPLKRNGLLTEDWSKAHGAYHAALVSNCPNRWLLRIRAQLYDQSERYRQYSVPMNREERDVAAEHQAIADAAISSNRRVAKRLIAEHLSCTMDIIVRSMREIELRTA